MQLKKQLKILEATIKQIYFNIIKFTERKPLKSSVIYGSTILIIFLLFISLSSKEKITYKKYFPELTGDAKLNFQKRIVNRFKKFKDLNIKIHIVQKGENYWQIAKEHNVNIDTIVGLNPYLKNLLAAMNEHLIVGDKIGVLHIVRKNETLKDISKLYNIKVKEITKANRINIFKRIFRGIREGDILFIPGVKPKILTKDMKHWYDLRDDLQSPLGGHYTSGFGMRVNPVTHKRRLHNGIDIGVRMRTPVGAANDGVVIYAGWAGGYGKMIKIKHYNGYTTLYGHLSRIYVRVGQKVKKGQIIARSGNTGRVTGPHLHFTVWYKGKLVNPVWFLW